MRALHRAAAVTARQSLRLLACLPFHRALATSTLFAARLISRHHAITLPRAAAGAHRARYRAAPLMVCCAFNKRALLARQIFIALRVSYGARLYLCAPGGVKTKPLPHARAISRRFCRCSCAAFLAAARNSARLFSLLPYLFGACLSPTHHLACPLLRRAFRANTSVGRGLDFTVIALRARWHQRDISYAAADDDVLREDNRTGCRRALALFACTHICLPHAHTTPASPSFLSGVASSVP